MREEAARRVMHFEYPSCPTAAANILVNVDTVSGALQKSGRPYQLIKVAGASADHPVHPMLPETG